MSELVGFNVPPDTIGHFGDGLSRQNFTYTWQPRTRQWPIQRYHRRPLHRRTVYATIRAYCNQFIYSQVLQNFRMFLAMGAMHVLLPVK